MALTILVVENEAAHRTLMSLVLQSNGYNVVCVRDGLEALEALATRAVDLVVMDAWMPHLNGFETTQRMRQTPSLAWLPIVFVTADAMAPTLQRIEALNPAAIVTKPFTVGVLLAAVQEALQRSRRPRAVTRPLVVRATTVQLYDASSPDFVVEGRG